MRHALPLTLLVALSAAAAPRPVPGPHSIFGRWTGHSDCVRGDWNRACNDERVLYWFEPAAGDSNHGVLHAYKAVQGEYASMGDLDYVHRPGSQDWTCDFSNARGSIRWSFHLEGDSLVGTLVQLPSGRVSRHAVARRGGPLPDSTGRIPVTGAR